jgi:uncharacterized RDD family membrane protein YckC
MQCRYCREWNEADERRCLRCGRRLELATRSSLRSYPLPNGAATAPALEALPGRRPIPTEQPVPENVSFQPSLFRDAGGGPKVIPIPTLALAHPRLQRREDSSHSRKSTRGTVRRSTESRPATDGRGVQQALDFHGRPKAAPEMEAVIYCDAPVAMPAHRLIAAAVDGSMVLIAVGMFLMVFFLAGGEISLTRQNIPFFSGVVVVVALFYRFLWCVADGDTPGMRFAGLRLVDFDGRSPDREQRGMRQLASVLSLISAGLGLVWALVDEENLTWHDHISKTFPTIG